MTTSRSLLVPSPFLQTPFFSSGDKVYSQNDKIWGESIFYHDIAYYYGELSGEFPWRDPKNVIKTGLNLWKENGSPLISEAIKARDRRKARPIMIKYLSIYIQMMVWAGEKPVKSLQDVTADLEKLSYSPMNSRERLSFVLSTPDHHHSFTTLSQLFNESEKKWAVYMLKLKK